MQGTTLGGGECSFVPLAGCGNRWISKLRSAEEKEEEVRGCAGGEGEGKKGKKTKLEGFFLWHRGLCKLLGRRQR